MGERTRRGSLCIHNDHTWRIRKLSKAGCAADLLPNWHQPVTPLRCAVRVAKQLFTRSQSRAVLSQCSWLLNFWLCKPDPNTHRKIGVKMHHTWRLFSHLWSLLLEISHEKFRVKTINSSLWLLTRWTDNVILHQSDHLPCRLQWWRVLTHRCRQQRTLNKQLHPPAWWLHGRPPGTMAQWLRLWQQDPN